MDTKGQELAFLAERLRAAGVPVADGRCGDAGERPRSPPDIARTTVIEHHPEASVRAGPVRTPTDRGQAISAMSQALEKFLLEEYQAGRWPGSSASAAVAAPRSITPAMRALPIGLPKLMVSTVASGNTAPLRGLL